jgi:murein DD-endopeptidase MepM/ murein hydrolase activator NlpD
MPFTKLRILTDRASGAERRFRLRTLVALSSLPLFGVVAAFGLAPDTNTLNISPETVIEAIALPELENNPEQEIFQRDSQIQPGDTLASALSRLNVNDVEIQRLLATDAVRQTATRVRSGQRIQATTTADGQLLAFRYVRAGDDSLTVLREGEEYVAESNDALMESRVVMRSGRINSSLYAATDSAGIPEKIADQIAETFSTSIDFRNDLRRGDTFSVVYTVNYRNGEPVAVGKMLAAEFINAGENYRAVLFEDPSGREAFYTPEGNSLKKGFLRSPLEFSRVTSSFSNSRKHPVYGFHRAPYWC